MSEKYSKKDFTGHDLSAETDMFGIEIIGSCFSQESPNRHIFPDEMSGVNFIDCNLDNCFIPEGNTIIRGSHRFFKVQEDGQDWLVDPITLEPIEPLQ